ALLRRCELYQFHLLELVLPDNAPYVTAIRAGFASKAGAEGTVAERERVARQRLVAIKIRHRHFRGRDQPQIGAFNMEEILGELRQLACAEEARRIHQKGREALGVPVLASMRIDHEVDERTFQTSQGAGIHHEASASNFGRTVKI